MTKLHCILTVILLFIVGAGTMWFLYVLHQRDDAAKHSLPHHTNHQYFSSELPVRIIIPHINVDAAIQPVGITPQGAMDVPTNTRDVGWYQYGSRPGATGSAVIAGHYDSAQGTPGVFEKLHLLIPGDIVKITDAEGKVTNFVIRKTRLYNPKEDTSEVFGQVTGTHLNLVTCDGSWDDTHQSYTKRLVILADLQGEK